MRKAVDVILIALGTLLALGVLLVFALNSEWMRAYIERKATERAGRPVQIGAIHVRPAWHPRVTIDDLRVANPDWAHTTHLVDAAEVRAEVALLPLFTGLVVIEDVLLAQAKVGLEQEGDRATWRFGPSSTEESVIRLKRVAIDQGHITYRVPEEKTALEIDVEGDLGKTGALQLTGKGRFRGHPVQAVVHAPAIVPSPDTPVEMTAKGTVGSIRVALAGSVRAAEQDGIDVRLDLSGQSLADLEEIIPMNLPDTPPYRLSGRVRNPGGVWTLDDLQGKVGDSDLRGRLTYDRGPKTPVLEAELASRLLDFDDLGPLVGAPPRTKGGETASARQKRKAEAVASSEHVLPDRPFNTRQWPRMNADVRLTAKRIERPDALPIDGLSTHLVMQDGKLALKPLKFDFAGGEVAITVALDGRSDPPQGKATIDFRGLRLARLFPKVKQMEASKGLVYGKADLAGRGASVAQLLGTSSGGVSLLVNGGTISNLVLELVGLDVAEALRIFATRDPQVQLRCAAADFEVKDGTAVSRTFVIDTRDTLIGATGKIDFKREFVDLVVHPAPKDPSPFALRTPLIVSGPFKDLGVKPQLGPLAARGAAAALLAAVNPLLALVPFIETGPGKDSDCASLAEQVRLSASPGGRNEAQARDAAKDNPRRAAPAR